MAILTYNHIGPCPPGEEERRGLWVDEGSFARQMESLRMRECNCVTLHDVVASLSGRWRLPPRWVCITFDDGWRDAALRALPALTRHGLRATFFMVTSRIRSHAPTGAWDEAMSIDEMRALREAGMEIGSHSHTHPRLTRLDPAVLRTEVAGSRELLGDVLGKRPDWFCYPYGNFSRAVAAAVREAGYAGAVCTIPDNRVRTGQRYWMPRVAVTADTTLLRLRFMLSPLYHLTSALASRERWGGVR